MSVATFAGLDLSTLQELKAAYTKCLLAIANNQSYSVSGRSLSRANLGEVKQTLLEITQAIDQKNGPRAKRVFPDFSRSRGNV